MIREKINIQIPFTKKWILKKCSQTIKTLNVTKFSYISLRRKIQNNCKFFRFKIPLTNIIVLKNYYLKNNAIVYIKPLFGSDSILIEKSLHKLKIDFKNKKNFNVFEFYKKERNGRIRRNNF